jgi:hypothetical protein
MCLTVIMVNGCTARSMSGGGHPPATAAPTTSSQPCRPVDQSTAQWIKRGQRTGESSITLHSGAAIDQSDGAMLVALWFTLDARPDQPAQLGVWRIKGPRGFAANLPAMRATTWAPIDADPAAVSHAEECAAADRPT